MPPVQETETQRWAQIAIKAGFPLVAATFLIWFVTVRITGELAAIKAGQEAILAAQHKTEAQNATAVEQMWQLIGVGQATCLNVSTTPEARLSCLAVDRRRSQ